MPRGRPKKEPDPLDALEIIKEIHVGPVIVDPRFGYSRPAPKPTKKGRKGKEEE